jgi:uncharacterized protein (TIGR03086 family)
VTLQPDVAFLRGLDFFNSAVRQLSAEDWQRASPCQGWRALDVLGHVGQATRFGTLLLQGAQPAWSPVEPPGAVIEGSPEAWWDDLAGQARSVVEGVDLSREVDSPVGRRSIGQGLSFPALDLYIHGWDIAKSAGFDLVIPSEAIEFTHAVIAPIPAEQVRSSRVFAAERPAPVDATESEVFLAWAGRDPAWHAPE